jgi:protein SERAC1
MASVPKPTVFRVTGLPADKTELEVQSILVDAIKGLLTQDERQQPEPKIGCVPSCDGSQTSTALVEFLNGTPQFLSQLAHDPLSDWQIELGDVDISFDRHFFGFTQLYPTAAGHPVTAEYSHPVSKQDFDTDKLQHYCNNRP